MRYLPVSLSADGRDVTVIGGGVVAEQRIRMLLDAEARVTVISPDVTEAVEALARSGSIRLRLRKYEPGDLAGSWVAMVATNDAKVNQLAWQEAQEQGIPVNVADDPPKCDFVIPALVRRGDLTIAISTGGSSPALAARLRRRIAGMFGPEYERLLEVLNRLRSRLKESVPDPEERKNLHYRIVDSNILSWVLASDDRTLEARIDDIVREPFRVAAEASGIVYIVGSGPGDPALITVRGLDRLRAADVVLHDRLIDSRLLKEVRPNAEVIDVGKRPGDGGRMQSFIHETMVGRARRGQIVCRLKAGDPFVFGRGGEEARALTGADVPFEIVPGVTSAIAVPGAVGIPLTHRDASHAFMVMTGSRADDARPEEWAGAASVLAGGGTLVILMGLSRLKMILERLRDAGCPDTTPAAVISRGTWQDQDVRTGRLADIAGLATGTVSPAVIVFGVTVGERGRLQEVRAAIDSGARTT